MNSRAPHSNPLRSNEATVGIAVLEPPVATLSLPPRDVLGHGVHTGCCLTSPFVSTTDAAPVAMIVVDPQGYFIHANPTAQEMLGYSLPELTAKHIFEVVDADAPWVASEFEHLIVHQTWNGHVLLKHLSGSLLKVTVNAYSNQMPDGSAEHVAFLYSTDNEGPAIVRLPDMGIEYGLSVLEIRLLDLIAAGFSDEEIAAIIGEDEAAVKNGVDVVRRKLNAGSRTEVGLMALREKLIA